jgi:hypothetical protein
MAAWKDVRKAVLKVVLTVCMKVDEKAAMTDVKMVESWAMRKAVLKVKKMVVIKAKSLVEKRVAWRVAMKAVSMVAK